MELTPKPQAQVLNILNAYRRGGQRVHYYGTPAVVRQLIGHRTGGGRWSEGVAHRARLVKGAPEELGPGVWGCTMPGEWGTPYMWVEELRIDDGGLRERIADHARYHRG
ncbi:hypothetical protein ACN20G_35380 (plasmid) [Streptomyces sp. BI20]|uniref:hypothetical protein n=1 Tax=Streptomyces sp. BI20 TaxID=3403460 RepID=UPI003C7070CF